MSSFKWIASVVVLVATITLAKAEILPVKVYGESAEEPFSYASTAVYVDESGLLVMGLPNDKTITKVTFASGGKEHQTQLLSYDQYARFAFLRLPAELLKGKKVSVLDTTKREKYTIGPEKKEFLFAGSVGRHNGQSIPFSFHRLHGSPLDASVFPIVKSGEGNVAGILHSKVPEVESAFYALPADVLAKSLADIKRFGMPTRAWVGVTLDANVGLPIVKSVRPASAAAKAGIQKGDIITSMAGLAVADYDAAVKNFYLMQAEKEVEVSVIRGMEKKKLKLTPGKFPTVSK